MNIHLKTTLGNIRRSPFQALAAIFILALTFFVATMLAVLTYFSGNLVKYFATRPQVIAFIKTEATVKSIADLQNKISLDGRVKDIRYVSKEEALKIYKDATSDNPLLAELVSPASFPASLEFSISEITLAQEVINDVKKEAIVDSVGFTASLGGEKTLGEVVTRLKTITYYLNWGGIGLVSALGATSFAILLVIVSMRMAARRSEIEILNLIGATPGFIRSPVVMEALFYCLAGVLLGWVAAFVVWLYVTPSLIGYFGEIPVLPKEATAFFLLFVKIAACELMAGIFLAVFGSMVALLRVRKLR